MKKVLSIVILLAFFGSMIVMTGCFGGSDGLTAGLAIFAIAIIVSGGTAAVPAFAANVKGNIRPAIAIADKANVTIKVFTLKNGVVDGTPIEIPATSIQWDDTDGDKNAQLKVNHNIAIADGYNEYKVVVYYNGTRVIEGIKFIKDANKTNQNFEVNPTSMAKSLMFESWKSKAPTKTYEAFDYNFTNDNPNITTLIANVDTALQTNTIAPDYTSGTIPTNVTTAVGLVNTVPVVYYYSVAGYVTAVDMTGSNDTMLELKRKSDGGVVNHVLSVSGSYSLGNVPDGTYVLTPTKANHSFTPASIDVTVNGANVSGQNFQASAFTASTKL